MNMQTNTVQNIQSEGNLTEYLTIGQQLCKVREEKKLTQDEVAKQLFLSKEIIAGLENDDYSKMIAPVYARGYIIAYARLMQVPNEEMLRDFKQATTSVDANEQSSIKVLHPIKMGAHQEQHGANWTAYTISAILIIGLFIWGYNQHRQNAAKVEPATQNFEATKASLGSNSNSAALNPNNQASGNTLTVTPINQDNFASPTTGSDTSSVGAGSAQNGAEANTAEQVTSSVELLPSADSVAEDRSSKTNKANKLQKIIP